jgi:hypothetical protein
VHRRPPVARRPHPGHGLTVDAAGVGGHEARPPRR